MSKFWPSEVKNGKDITERGVTPRLIVLLALLLAVTLALGGYLYLCFRPEDGVLLGRTYLNGIDVSGMTATQAVSALQGQFRREYADTKAEVTLAGERYTLPLFDALTLQSEALVERAMERGHGPFITRGVAYLQARGEDYREDILPRLTDLEALSNAIAATDMGSVNTVQETEYEIGEESVLIHKGVPGICADLDALAVNLTAAVNRDPGEKRYRLDCPTRQVDIAPLDLEAIHQQVYCEVQDATVDGENDYAIIPSVTGVSFDIEQAKADYEAAGDGAEVEIAYVFTQPEVSTQWLEEHLFADALGSFATNVSGSDGRRQNVRLAAERCCVVLMPGEQFSYNQRVGKRTTDRGFSEAGAYLNGELVMEVGGGVCQASSTLYMACVMSNLQIDKRYNHTYPSGYIGLGLDATVSWGGPDFLFTNNTRFPIQITCRYSSGRLSFTIYGSKLEDFSVEVVSEVLAGSGKGRTYVSTASSANGGQPVAYTGRYSEVQTYRKVYDADGNLVSTTKEAYSYYKTHEE